MKRRYRKFTMGISGKCPQLLGLVLILPFVSYTVCAQISLSYNQKTSAFSSGAGSANSASYSVKATIGQPINGNSTSTSYLLLSGFTPGSSAIAPRFPDLLLTASGILPTTVTPGQSTAATFSVKNAGDVTVAGSIKVKAYLSINTAVDAGDVELASFTVGTTLAVNAQIDYPGAGQPNAITIPAGTELKSYQIILVLDPDNVITEKHEDNNSIALPLSVSNTTGPSAQLSIGTVALASNVASVQVLNGIGSVHVAFHHRKIAEANDTPVDVTSGTTTYQSTITDDMQDELGVEFYFSATDDVNSVESTHSFSYRVVDAASSGIPFGPGFDGTAATYQMFSVPYALTEPIASTVFDELGGADKTKWRLFHWQVDKYREFPDNLTNIDPGKGYWFNTKQKTEISAGPGTVIAANQMQPFKLILDQGWNQIGDPYPFNVSWDAVKGANGAAGLNSLWLFENGTYVKKDVLGKWKGAFTFSDNGGEIIFPVLAKTTSNGRVNEDFLSPDIDGESWQVPITMELNGLERVSGIGMNPDAKGSKDKFDEMTVPRFIDYVELNTFHDEFFSPYFSTDIVQTQGEKSWIFTASSNQKGGHAVLRWDRLWIAGAKASLILIDLTDGNWVNMKNEGQYPFSWSEGRQFKIVFNKNGEVQPGVTVLGSAFPNPFSERVTIPVVLETDQLAVQIDVYDLMGRKVKSIWGGSAKAGVHAVGWDGQNDHGSSVENGLYLYQLRGDRGILSPPKRLIKQ